MNNNFNYKVNPIFIALAATFVTIFTSICSDFGNVDVRNSFGDGEISGTFIIIAFLILPLFFKGYREYIWTKKGLVILFIALVINLPIAIYCIINRWRNFGTLL